MDLAATLVSIPLIAEFVFAPFNLWTGRTMGNFLRFTGLPARAATHVVAPVKAVTAAVLTAGIFVPAAGSIGAVLVIAISAFYLIRLAPRSRRDISGLIGFSVFAGLGIALLSIRTFA